MKVIKGSMNGRQADIVRLDVHNWYGSLMHRVKGKTTDPLIGIMMIDLIKDLYGLSDEAIQTLRNIQQSKELKDQMKLNSKN